MPSLHVRKPFAAAFAVLLLAAAYLGLSTPKIPQYGQSDKGLHFVTFFLLTLAFYWVIETSRRRVIHLTLLVCTAGLGIGSEIVLALLPNGQDFDPFDILANVVGSTLALLLCSWYHKRMLERRRKNKHYDIVPGDEPGEDEADRDLELGQVGGEHEQDTGTMPTSVNGQAGPGADQAGKGTNVTEELDNWNENADDEWDDEAGTSTGEGQKTPASSSNEDGADSKKRAD